LRLILFLAIFGAIAGCTRPLGIKKEHREISLAELIAIYQHRREGILHIKGLMEVTVIPAKRQKQVFHAAWRSNPQHIKIHGFNLLGGTLFHFELTEETVSFVMPVRRLNLQVSRDKFEEAAGEKIPLGSLEMLEWVREGGIPKVPPHLVPRLEKNGPLLVLTLSTAVEDKMDLQEKIWIELDKLLVKKVEIFDKDHARRAIMKITEYQKIGVHMIPSSIEWEGPEGTVQLRWIEIDINPQVTRPVGSFHTTDDNPSN